MRVITKSSQRVATERKIRQLINAGSKKTNDDTKFKEFCSKYRIECINIRGLANVPKFRGGYDEIESIYSALTADNNELMLALKRLEAIDKVCKYEGEKLGYKFSEWWNRCWEEELTTEAKGLILSR